MKVDLIKTFAKRFAEDLANERYALRVEKYVLLNSYQRNWDLSELDLGAMYASCFQSEISGSLWGGSKYSAKESMLTLIDQDAHFVRQMFRDLFNDGRDLTLRIDRFLHHCEAVAKDIKQQTGHWVDPHHSYREVSLYLALEYPDRYTLFDADDAMTAFRILGAKQDLQMHQVARYFILCQTLYKLVVDEHLIDVYTKLITHFQTSTMIIHDFCHYLRVSESD